MLNHKKLQCQKGLTLVEILAAIVILSIVLLSFSSFFLQSAKNTKYNEKKLTAIEIAEEVVADIRTISDISSLDNFSKISTDPNPIEYENNTTYLPHKVKVKVEDGPVGNLMKATITVSSDENRKQFTTEMYFE
ncbi:type II secretion system protein [Sporosarcina sp. 179-K 3D1 HS]|uniref:type IV pilus modification PilV family protein n=1 Tax=Sporosarcina sp. 179-K 3D1 HS TaxID=3232169 RepID=UPI0039A23E8D